MRRRHTATRRARSLRRRRRQQQRLQRGGGTAEWGARFLGLLKDRAATIADQLQIPFSSFTDSQLSLEAIKESPEYKVRMVGNEQGVHLYDIAADIAPVLEGLRTVGEYRQVYEENKANEEYAPTFAFLATAEKALREELFRSSQPNELTSLPAETSPVLLMVLVANLPSGAQPRAPILGPAPVSAS